MTPQLAGARWRLLVHRVNPQPLDDGPLYDLSYDVTSDPQAAEKEAATAQRLVEIGGRPQTPQPPPTVLLDTEFDELVVGSFLHIEQMDEGLWWMNIGGVTVHVRADPDGNPTSVRVSGPLDYDEPREGVVYECTWTEVEP
jgi:hypothetical protein